MFDEGATNLLDLTALSFRIISLVRKWQTFWRSLRLSWTCQCIRQFGMLEPATACAIMLHASRLAKEPSSHDAKSNTSPVIHLCSLDRSWIRATKIRLPSVNSRSAKLFPYAATKKKNSKLRVFCILSDLVANIPKHFKNTTCELLQSSNVSLFLVFV